MRRPVLSAIVTMLMLSVPGIIPTAAAADGCAVLARRVDDISTRRPVFLRSYDGPDGKGGPAFEPPLRESAFTYDNALAAIALVACGRPDQANRIGEALLAAATGDRAGPNGRLRNAYRAGALKEVPPLPPGWWDKGANQWVEDAYQVGTATGNVAWAALALLTLHEQSGRADYRDAAAGLLRWAVQATASDTGPGGFSGGVHGFETAPVRLTWRSTEHNTDLAAAFAWMARLDPAGPWTGYALQAQAFVATMWQADQGRFLAGTLPDGVTPNSFSGLDAQLWPLLLADAPAAWRRSLDWVEARHAAQGGFDFNDDADGIWLEGTAQAALAYRLVGRMDEVRRLLGELDKEWSEGGYLYATRQPRITTGLAIGPDSTSDDFYYYRRPHLGATAWAVLAARGWNPFTGKPLG